MTESEIFLRNVENYAKENCLDLTQLCRLAGVSNNYIQGLKANGFNPTFNNIKKIADYMKMSIPEIFCLKEEYAEKQLGLDTKDFNYGNMKNLKEDYEKLQEQWIKTDDENKSLQEMNKIDAEDIHALKAEIKSLKEKKVNLEDLDIVVFMCRNKDEMYVEIDGEKIDLKCKEVDGERGYITLELPYKSTTFYTAKEPDTDE